MHDRESVSIIVPVYNAERYIAACLDSLVNQTLHSCEFILVDDGSTDQSRAIIEHFRQKDDRIHLITQSNQGVSAARNAGLSSATGEYVGFVDADDYIEPDMYERLYEAAKSSSYDVVLSNFESELEGTKLLTTYPFPLDRLLDRSFIIDEVMPYFLQSDQMNTAVNKLYRLELIHEHKVQFPYQVALGEDGLFNMNYFSYAESMVYIDYSGYHYREVPGSATRNIVKKDYFSRALEVYLTAPPPIYTDLLSHDRIKELQAIRLIHTTLSYIYIYFKAANEMNIFKRFEYVRHMITNEHVRQALPIYRKHKSPSMNRYEKYMLALVQAKSTFGLMCAVAYSRYRNS